MGPVTRGLPSLTRSDQLVGVVLVVIAAIGFGSGPFFADVAYDAGMRAMPILFWRFVAATAISWAVVLVSASGREALRSIGRRRALVMLGLGVLYIGNSSTYVAALETVPIAVVSMIVYIYPALVAVLSVRFLRRLEGRRAWVALGVSMAGVLLAVGGIPEGSMPPVEGLVLAVLSPITYAIWIVLSARSTGERRGPARPARTAEPEEVAEVAPGAGASAAAVVASTLMITATTATAGAWLVLTGQSVQPASVPTEAWPALIGFGLATAIAFQAFYGGLRRVGGARASLIATVEPVYTIAVATLFFGEVLTPVQLLGGILVIGGVLLAETGSRPGRPRPARPVMESEGAATRAVGATMGEG
jgi:drug/metabolite transporter (DMT)-like permease